jgi:hypothetical protein
MRSSVLVTLAIGLVSAAVPGTAHAAVQEPWGSRCGLSTLIHPTDTSKTLAQLNGGPLVVSDDESDDPVYASLTCSIHLGVANVRHSGADAASATSPTTPTVVMLPPTLVEYDWLPAQNLYLCAQVDVVGGPTWYWARDTRQTGQWSTDPESECTYDTDEGEEFVPDEVWDLVDAVDGLIGDAEHLVDAVTCPALATLYPPEGDVPDVWDCPPYGNA